MKKFLSFSGLILLGLIAMVQNDAFSGNTFPKLSQQANDLIQSSATDNSYVTDESLESGEPEQNVDTADSWTPPQFVPSEHDGLLLRELSNISVSRKVRMAFHATKTFDFFPSDILKIRKGSFYNPQADSDSGHWFLHLQLAYNEDQEAVGPSLNPDQKYILELLPIDPSQPKNLQFRIREVVGRETRPSEVLLKVSYVCNNPANASCDVTIGDLRKQFWGLLNFSWIKEERPLSATLSPPYTMTRL